MPRGIFRFLLQTEVIWENAQASAKMEINTPESVIDTARTKLRICLRSRTRPATNELTATAVVLAEYSTRPRTRKDKTSPKMTTVLGTTTSGRTRPKSRPTNKRSRTRVIHACDPVATTAVQAKATPSASSSAATGAEGDPKLSSIPDTMSHGISPKIGAVAVMAKY